jgi:hypothetical protein
MATPAELTDQREPIVPRFEPGFFTEASAVDAATRWKLGDKVRFNGAQPEKIGGWLEQALTGADHSGVARRVHEWSSLDGESWIAYGTNTKLYVVNRNIRYDITPVRRTINLTNPFTTTLGSPTVLVQDDGHSSEPGDAVRFSGASAVGGITIDGEYTITEVIDGNFYEITHSINATSAATGGGTVNTDYDINIGSADRELATGWGVCAWGESTWGTARSTSCSGVFRELRTWSLDNFGEDLIASPRGGAVYWWDKTTGPLSRAVVLATAPRTNQRVLISNSGGQIICLGAFDDVSNTPDPMFIRVGAEESLTDFTLSDTEDDTVFEERLATGSQVITGVRTRAGIFVSTDEANYLMQEDQFNVFRVTKLGEGNTACGPNAMLEIDGVAYMMTPKKFFTFDGVLEEIPCDVWRYVFQGTPEDPNSYLDTSQIHKVYAWYNEKFSEIWWHYPSVGGAGENDRYVIFNKKLRRWYFGTINRTAASSPGPTYGNDIPVAFESDGTMYLHENGVNDNVSAIDSFIESHDVQIAEGGKNELHLSQTVPDMMRQTGTVLLYLKGKHYPNDTAYVEKGPYTVLTTTKKKGVRITARQIALRFRSNTVGADWHLGAWRFYAQPDKEGA